MQDPSPQVDAEAWKPTFVHLAEAMESKHRVRERLVRALARSARESVDRSADGSAAAGSRPFDPALDEAMAPETVLELNPLGEYLLNCEISDRTFIL